MKLKSELLAELAKHNADFELKIADVRRSIIRSEIEQLKWSALVIMFLLSMIIVLSV